MEILLFGNRGIYLNNNNNYEKSKWQHWCTVRFGAICIKTVMIKISVIKTL